MNLQHLSISKIPGHKWHDDVYGIFEMSEGCNGWLWWTAIVKLMLRGLRFMRAGEWWRSWRRWIELNVRLCVCLFWEENDKYLLRFSGCYKESAIKTPRVLFIKLKKRWLGLRWQEADLGVSRIYELRSEADCSDARLFTVCWTFSFVVKTRTERRRPSLSHINPANRAAQKQIKAAKFHHLARLPTPQSYFSHFTFTTFQ